MRYLAMLKNYFERFLDLDAVTDDFRNLINFSLSLDTVSSFYVKLLTDRQTNRQTYIYIHTYRKIYRAL